MQLIFSLRISHPGDNPVALPVTGCSGEPQKWAALTRSARAHRLRVELYVVVRAGGSARLLLDQVLLRLAQLLRHRVREQHLLPQVRLARDEQPEPLRADAAEQEEDDASRGVEDLAGRR